MRQNWRMVAATQITYRISCPGRTLSERHIAWVNKIVCQWNFRRSFVGVVGDVSFFFFFSCSFRTNLPCHLLLTSQPIISYGENEWRKKKKTETKLNRRRKMLLSVTIIRWNINEYCNDTVDPDRRTAKLAILEDDTAQKNPSKILEHRWWWWEEWKKMYHT